MNKSNWEHVIFAVLMQLAIGIPFGNWWGGALLAIGFFAGREHSQREYQITKGFPVGDLNPFQGFKGWSPDSKRDFYPAAGAVTAIAIYFEYFFK